MRLFDYYWLFCCLEHGCPVECHHPHSGWDDDSYSLCEGGPWDPSHNRFPRCPAVFIVCIWTRKYDLHWDEQVERHCDQRGCLYGKHAVFSSDSCAWLTLWSKNNHPCMFPPQHSIIYFLCILIKDPADPETVTSVVPLFQVWSRWCSFGKASL